MGLARLVEYLVGAPEQPLVARDAADFWQELSPTLADWSSPLERAVVSGFAADRLGYAFLGGYRAALSALVGGGPSEALVCLCATEVDGAHPRAIRTRLTPCDDGGFVLSGEKHWATLAPLASAAVVIASMGAAEDGKNRLRAVRLELAAEGVSIEPMPSTPFVPEVPHAVVRFHQVSIASEDVLPGDGYDRYLKPFRTLEDIFVHAALLGHLIGFARRAELPRATVERAIAIVLGLSALSAEEPLAATTHLALAGLLDQTRLFVESLDPAWAEAPAEERDRWRRDVALTRVAGRAREARRDSAWKRLGSAG